MKIVFLIVASIFCLFYGFKAVEILVDNKRTPAWWFHQFWINFAGSATGWGTVYYLIYHKFKIFSDIPEIIIGPSEVVLIIIGLLGVVGFLPSTLSRITSIGK